tara:strand:- start:6736 stop:8301 length:1566 start_codon:yes stop_codon:yes gene_type:complete
MAQQETFELPNGWVIAKIQDICEKITDGSHNPPKAKESGVPMLSAKNISEGKISFEGGRLIAEEDFALEHKRTRVSAGDVLLTTVATLGRTAVVSEACERFALQRSVSVLGSQKVDSFFLKYSLDNPEVQSFINMNARGNAQKGFYIKQLKELQIRLSPLEEQKRIVEKLDSLLAQVDTIQQRLNNLPNIIKRFRQSVLAAAVSGKLTEQWRETNKPKLSDDEFHSQVENYRYNTWVEEKLRKYNEKGKLPKTDAWKKKYVAPAMPETNIEELPKGWIPEVLEGLVYISARIGWKGLKASEYTEEGPLFLSVHGLNYGQYVKLDKAFHISEERYLESPEIMLKNEDILLCKDGAGIGKIGIVQGLEECASINSSLLLIRSGKFFNTKFLFYFLSGPTMQALVQERMTGSAVPHLFQRDVKEFVLSVPPMKEQIEIVRLVEQYFALADTLEKNLANAKQRVDNLTQSILAKAFKGELVPQDPNDEPADKLLERIKAARLEAEKLEKAAKNAAKASKASKVKK